MKKTDYLLTLIPGAMIILVSCLLFLFPEKSNLLLSNIRFFLGDTLGSFYILMGIGVFTVSVCLAFSKYGSVRLGGTKPRYSFFSWGSMMFTCGLAADILFYSYSEWIMYAGNPHVSDLGGLMYAGVFPLFHWSFIPWGFYLVFSVIFGYMLHVNKRKNQRFSEALRPLLGKYSDMLPGKVIDLFSLFALLAGTATTFSVATPLLSEILLSLTGLHLSRSILTLIILSVTFIIYSYAAVHGIKGMSVLSRLCIYIFFFLLFFVLIFGGQAGFIIENSIQSLGLLIQNFLTLSTYTDPGRENFFAQDWTIYYWAYWMVWTIAAPFFIGKISEGRTIKEVILGGYLFGVGATLLSFLILGNYSLSLEIKGLFDFTSLYEKNGDIYSIILMIIDTFPFSKILLIITMLSMIAFYATSFDSIAYTAALISTKSDTDSPGKGHVFFWCILLILLPMALVFSESQMSNIQSVSIISAFPIGIIMILMIVGFFKELRNTKL